MIPVFDRSKRIHPFATAELCVQEYNMGILIKSEYYSTYQSPWRTRIDKPRLTIRYKNGYIFNFEYNDMIYFKINEGFSVLNSNFSEHSTYEGDPRSNEVKYYDLILNPLSFEYVTDGITVGVPSDQRFIRLQYYIMGTPTNRRTYYINQFGFIPQIIDYLTPYFPKEIAEIIKDYAKDYKNLSRARDFLIAISKKIDNDNALNTINMELVTINSILPEKK